MFKREGDFIVGYGLTLGPTRDGTIRLDADLLNQLLVVLRDELALGADDAARVLQKRREQSRIEDAKNDLIESLGLDTTKLAQSVDS